MPVGIDSLSIRKRDHDPDDGSGELDRGQDGGDDQLRPGRDVRRPPGRLGGRVEDPGNPVGLRQEGTVHEAAGAKVRVKNDPVCRGAVAQSVEGPSKVPFRYNSTSGMGSGGGGEVVRATAS